MVDERKTQNRCTRGWAGWNGTRIARLNARTKGRETVERGWVRCLRRKRGKEDRKAPHHWWKISAVQKAAVRSRRRELLRLPRRRRRRRRRRNDFPPPEGDRLGSPLPPPSCLEPRKGVGAFIRGTGRD